MYNIVTEIDLQTSAARVWAALTDFASYRAWNPVIESIDGSPTEGARASGAMRTGRGMSPGEAPNPKKF